MNYPNTVTNPLLRRKAPTQEEQQKKEESKQNFKFKFVVRTVFEPGETHFMSWYAPPTSIL